MFVRDNRTSRGTKKHTGVVRSIKRYLENRHKFWKFKLVAACYKDCLLPVFTLENIKTEDEGFDKWFELFEKRAQFASWKPEQSFTN